MSHTQSIAYTWDGNPIAKKNLVHVHTIQKKDGLHINIDAPFYNDPAPQEASGSLWELWKYEVVEIFLVDSNGQYLEAEFGPHGHHLLLWLDSPRNITKKHLPVSYSAKIQGNRWKGTVHMDFSILPDPIVQWNIFSIHGQEGHRNYHCMKPLQTPKPDFHRPDQFPLFPEAS
jgi:hypothetical protein